MAPLRWRTVALALALSSPAAGQTASAPPPVASMERSFRLPAGDLAASLQQFALQSGLQTTVDASLVSHRGAPEVHGNLTATEALRRLLEGSGLAARINDVDGTVLIAPDAGSGLILLPTVSVVARAPDRGYQAPTSASIPGTSNAVRDAPQSVSVVTRQQIDDQAMQGMADVLRYTPGIGFSQGEGYRGDTPVIRGITTSSDFFANGLRDDFQYARDPYNVERVEVLTGPSALLFGRSGAGGVVNRITREAEWSPIRTARLQLSPYGGRRLTADVGDSTDDVAWRLNALYDTGGSHRDGVRLTRWALNPTAAWRPRPGTLLRFGYEHVRDDRVADRGVPSWHGKPVHTDAKTFFGNADLSPLRTTVDAFELSWEQDLGDGARVRSRGRYAVYDRSSRNLFASGLSADGRAATLLAYGAAGHREAAQNTTQVDLDRLLWGMQHELSVGLDLVHQDSTSTRETGSFSDNGVEVTSILAPVGSPQGVLPVIFRANPAASGKSTLRSVGAFLQDRVRLLPDLAALAGVRLESMSTTYRSLGGQRTRLSRQDVLVTGQAGLVYKFRPDVSTYLRYSQSAAPRSAEQLSSMTSADLSLSPERATGMEIGLKWDVRPDLSLNLAAFRTTQRNATAPDPTDVPRTIVLARQSVEGIEFTVNGQLSDNLALVATYSWQKGTVVAASDTAVSDKASPAQLPEHSVAVWGRYDFSDAWGIGLGAVGNSARHASTSNKVVMPGYMRLDAAAYHNINEDLQVQVNVENVFGARYFSYANSDNNITPAAPTTVRLTLVSRF